MEAVVLSRPGRSLRQTGIPAVGPAPWGTHFCQFYATREDLIDVLVPYFKAGLVQNECCMWVTSPPLGREEAWKALAAAVPGLDAYRERGAIEILPHTEWYLLGGRFDRERVLKGWVDKLKVAKARGLSGLRLSGNTFWLEKADWKSFADYEEAIDAELNKHDILALCTYSVDRCGAAEIADVIRNHQFALLKRDGAWDLIESFDRRRLSEAHARELAAEHEQLAVTLRSIGDAVVSTDTEGRIVTLNEAAEGLTGWRQPEASGRLLRDVVRVVDEESGEPAEDVVAQVLAAGRVVGSCARACVVSRGGARRAIEETAAPIRGQDGATAGVVLVFRDVSAKRQAERALREADRRKNEFLAVLSHELRNPLAPVKNSLYVLEHAAPGTEQALRAMGVLRRQVEQISLLVDDLLDVTRITRNKIELKREVLDLVELVRRAAEDQRSLFDHAQIRLELDLPPGPIIVEADPTRLTQVVGNLLQNSAKFTLALGTTRVRVFAEEGQAVVAVSDTGLGIAPDALRTLFEPFMQADKTHGRRGGLGLGLALVKGLVEQHGGQVHAKSDGPGAGSEFTVTLPLSAARLQPDAHGTHRARPTPRRVLLIEDNVDVADSLREALELDSHQVAVAHDGPEGLRLARELEPEVVLCDIGLPGMDGYEVARAFRRDPALSRLFLVALSGYAAPEDRQSAAQAGFDFHLAKPPSLEKLEELLAGLRPEGGRPTLVAGGRL